MPIQKKPTMTSNKPIAQHTHKVRFGTTMAKARTTWEHEFDVNRPLNYTPFLPLSITLCAKRGRHQNTTEKAKHKKGKTFRFYVLMFYEYKFQYPVNYARVASLHWRRTANEIKLGFALCFSRFRGAFHIWRYVGCWCVCGRHHQHYATTSSNIFGLFILYDAEKWDRILMERSWAPESARQMP